MAGTNIIEIRVAGTGTNLNPSASSGSSGTGSLAGIGGKLGVIAGAAMLVVNLLGDMLSVFKPVMTILKTIAKLLGEFLRPIAEFAIALLQPFLAFLKPMVMIFRAMMLPVMNLVRQYSAVMTSQMASGDYAGATKTGVDIIGLTLGGFFISMANVLGTMLINIVGNLLSTLTTGIISGLYTLVRPLLDVFLGDNQMAVIDAKVAELNFKIEDLFKTGTANATLALQSGTETMMNSLIGHYTTKLSELQTEIEPKYYEILAPLTTVVGNSEASVSDTMTTLDTNVKTATDNMTTNVNNAFNTVGLFSIPSKFGSGLSSMLTATSEFTTSMESYATRIKSALSSASSNAKVIASFKVGSFGATITKSGE